MAQLTLFNVGICLVVAIGSFAYGFGFGVFITAIGEPGFYVYFNLDRESTTAEPVVYLPLSTYYQIQLRIHTLLRTVLCSSHERELMLRLVSLVRFKQYLQLAPLSALLRKAGSVTGLAGRKLSQSQDFGLLLAEHSQPLQQISQC